jgi:uncharacterized membrane protein
MEPLTIALALAEYAPQLIKWVTGNDKAEKVATIAVDVAKKVSGATTGEGAIELLKADPKLAAEFADKIAEREADLEKAYLADVSDARKMQIAALQQDDLFSKRFIYYFSIGWSVFAMIYMAFVTFAVVENAHAADVILGFLLGTAIAGILQFFYGNTKKSQERSDNLYKSALNK